VVGDQISSPEVEGLTPQQSTITKENQIDRNNNEQPQGFNGIGNKMNRGNGRITSPERLMPHQ